MGFLSDTISLVRQLSDEPATNEKYSDTNIIGFIETDWGLINGELARLSTNRILTRVSLSLTSGIEHYALPPTIGAIQRITQASSSNSPRVFYSMAGMDNPLGRGVSLQGRTLVIEPDYTGSGVTINIDYIASGSVKLHTGTCTIDTTNSDTEKTVFVLGDTPSAGTLDRRPHAYAGQILRILSDGSDVYEQDMVITSYDVVNQKATCKPAANDSLLGTYSAITEFDYEITPNLSQIDSTVIAYATARRLMANEGDSRYQLITQQYTELMRNLRLNASQFDGATGMVYQGDSVMNNRYLSQWWWS